MDELSLAWNLLAAEGLCNFLSQSGAGPERYICVLVEGGELLNRRRFYAPCVTGEAPPF